MEFRQLGETTLKVSSIGMGCVTFGREIDEATSFEVLDRARERGINLYDTAEAYAQGGSEAVLGKWIADRGLRDEIVLATKLLKPLTKERVIKAAEDSLRRLQTDVIDLYQVHVWDDETPLEETLEALTSLVKSGKIRYVGCSNWLAWQLAKSLLLSQSHGFAKMQSIQPAYNLAQREIEVDTLPLCANQQIGVLGYSPLGGGFLTGKYGHGNQVPQGTRFDVIPAHQPIYFNDNGYSTLDRLEQARTRTGLSMVTLSLAWVLRQTSITSMLIGARNTTQVDQAFEAEQAHLDDETLALLG